MRESRQALCQRRYSFLKLWYLCIKKDFTALTCLYGGELFASSTRVDVLQLQTGDEWTLDDDALGYVCRVTVVCAGGQRLQAWVFVPAQ